VPCGNDDRLGVDDSSIAEGHAHVTRHRGHRAFDDRQVRLGFENRAYGSRVEVAIALRAGSLHRRTLRTVEHLELNAGLVRRFAHESAEGVDFFDEVAFGETTNRRVA